MTQKQLKFATFSTCRIYFPQLKTENGIQMTVYHCKGNTSSGSVIPGIESG